MAGLELEQETSVDDGSVAEDRPPQTVDGVEQEVVILVVGNDRQLKHDVVQMLTEGHWEKETTPAKVRIYTGHGPPRCVVVNTTPLQYIKDKSVVAFARGWISQNSLRRIIFGKLVLVICVVTSSIAANLQCHVTDVFNYNKCWVDVLRLIFGDHKRGTMILVKTEGDNVHTDLGFRKQLELFVTIHGFKEENITYSNFMEGDRSVLPILNEIARFRKVSKQETVRSFVSRKLCFGLEIFCFGKKRDRIESTSLNSTMELKPFLMKEVTSKTNGPWAPEKVILFGRTGSGKSTLAQMLTSGKLDPNSKVFTISHGTRGGTLSIEQSEGRGWYVVDTPGLGEPDEGTISSDMAELKVKKFVKIKEGLFSHYLFVTKKRVDKLDEDLWEFFKEYFGKRIIRQFSIVISDADPEWLKRNTSDLQKSFKECDSFLCADFPTAGPDAAEEKEEQENRMKSLKALEDELARLERSDVVCRFGKHSKGNLRSERNRANEEMRIERDKIVEILVRTSDSWFRVADIVSQLSSIFSADDGITLSDPSL